MGGGNSNNKKDDDEDDKVERKVFRGRGGKKPKDPNAPKKGQSSYLLFSNDVRSEFVASNPGKKITEISKLIGLKWKELSEDERKVYSDKALVLREQYKKEMVEYEKTQNYKDYMEILRKWNEEQMKESDDEEEEKGDG